MKNCENKCLRLLIVFCLLILLTAGEKAVAQKLDFGRLEEIINSELKQTAAPGAAVAVVSGHRVVFAKSFGVASVETNVPVTTETLFRVGSLTKTFTALAVLGMAEEGKLKLDEPVGNHLKNLNPKIGRLTFHQLLAHTSGLRDEGRAYGPRDEAALLETVRGWNEEYFFGEPGHIFSYSNLNYSLLGAALEQTSGKPFADLMRERLFAPLGMNGAAFRPTEAMTFPLAQGHHARGNAKPIVVRPFTENTPGWPAGFMFASANDLARFAAAFLNNGRIEGGKPAISPAVIAKAVNGYVEIPGLNVKYGYGLRIEEMRGARVVSHGGAIPGFGAQLLIAPENRLAIIVLTNKSGGRLEKSVEAALEMMIPALKPKPAAKTPSILSVTDDEIRNFSGVYRHSPRQILGIVARAGKLYLKDEDDLIPLQKIKDKQFLYTRANPAAASPTAEPDDLTFAAGASGEIEYLHVNGRAFKKMPEERR